MKRLLRSLLWLPLLAAWGPIHADALTAPEPKAQQQCFQMQFLLRLPGFEALHFIQAVKALREIDPNDEANTAKQVAALGDQALALRRDEARAYTQLGPLFKDMGATPPLQAWAATEADRLSKPLVYSKDEQKDAKAEPAVAAILAALDEADALKADADSHLSALSLWLSLTHGTAGLWAGDMGEATAALHVALTNNEEPRLTVAVARRLRAAAPAGTPATVRDALGLLVPKGGNLSGLVPVVTANVPHASLTQAHDALLDAFGAKGLV